MSDLEAAIDRDTVKTPDPLFAGAAQRYEQAESTMRSDPALRYDSAIVASAASSSVMASIPGTSIALPTAR